MADCWLARSPAIRPGEPETGVALFKHLLKRLFIVLAGYCLAVLVGLVAVALIYAVLSSLPGAPAYFDAAALSPVVVIALPGVALFIYLIALVLTAAQALVAALLAEIFALRHVAIHAIFGGLIGVSGFVSGSPTMIDGIGRTDWADIGVIAAASMIAGVVYWLVAGRDAGWRPAQTA